MKQKTLSNVTMTIQRNTSTLQQQQQSQDDEDPATTASTELLKPADRLPQPSSQRMKRRVHFREDLNVSYANHVQTREDVTDQWYSAPDLVKFRRDARDNIVALRGAERLSNDPESWAKSLLQVYQVFCAANTPADLETLMPRAPRFTLSTHTIGMEKRAILAIARDSTARREQIHSMILHWQSAPLYNDDLRSQMMREASCVVSRPSRLYARNIALISAAANL